MKIQLFVLIIILTLVPILGLRSESFPEKGKNMLIRRSERASSESWGRGNRVVVAKVRNKRTDRENCTQFFKERKQCYMRQEKKK